MHALPKLKATDRAKLRRLLAGGEFAPVMNNTKWAELIEEMQGAVLGMSPRFRLKSLLAPAGHVAEWDGDWHYHIHPVEEIEWLHLRADSAEWLASVLRSHQIPYSLENGLPRVWGYVNPNAPPHWE